MRTEIVEAELHCQLQRLGAGIDRSLVFIREHLVTRDLTEHRHLDARRRSVRNERPRIFEIGDRVVASSLPPGDVRQHEYRLRRRLTVPAREQRVACLCKLVLTLLMPQVERPPEAEEEVRMVGIARLSSSALR